MNIEFDSTSTIFLLDVQLFRLFVFRFNTAYIYNNPCTSVCDIQNLQKWEWRNYEWRIIQIN